MTVETHDITSRFERFFIPEPNSGCWLWTGCYSGSGYGTISIRGKATRAHRAAWMLYRGGRLRKGIYVCHRCDTPACVNPDHLFLGTPRQNNRDCKAKGRTRAPNGSERATAKLTEQQVSNICADRRTYRAIAEEYSVSPTVIQKIKAGKAWVHITGGKRSSLGPALGERNGKSKITDNDVRTIRGDPRANKVIAADYALSRQQIHLIKRRVMWRHVD